MRHTLGPRFLPGRGTRGSPSKSCGTGCGLPALAAQPLPRMATRPPPDWPCDAETQAQPPGHSALRRWWGKCRARRSRHRAESSFLQWAPAPTRCSGARDKSGVRPSRAGVTLGTRLLPQNRASQCRDGIRLRHELQALRPEASKGVGAPRTKARPARAPWTGALRVREARRRSRGLCVSPCEGWRPPHSPPHSGREWGAWVSGVAHVAQSRGATCKARGRQGQADRPRGWPEGPGRGEGASRAGLPWPHLDDSALLLLEGRAGGRPGQQQLLLMDQVV